MVRKFCINWRQPATTSDYLASTSPGDLKNGAWQHKNLAWRQHAEHSALWRFKCKTIPKFIKR
ncbi:hypothetical protein A2U01_0055818, partial [Trifolium medium]|nr:hypothetical protein [Trifolium medium]